MSLSSGTRLGPYEIVEPIGAGGMGEVFRALDTRLDREVAIKILPSHWADDTEMRERFDREAQAIASLNHPNICALHDIGEEELPAGDSEEAGTTVSYLVMELLEGETLGERLRQGPLDLDAALDIAIPIAEALDQAHRHGVVHRDLKPGNVMLTPDGPKLLDFGLAVTPPAPKGADGSDAAGSGSTPDGASADSMATSAAPVPTLPLTTPGLLIGTLQYMAPEQLDGLEADERTDIFAFGVMLHEMITGERAFQGDSQVLLISSIATSDPAPLSTVQPEAPPALEHVVQVCMAKNPADRWQTARDLLAELTWIAGGGAAASAIIPAAGGEGRRLTGLRYGLAAAAVLVALLAVPAYSYFQPSLPAAEIRYRLWSLPFRSQPHQDGSFAISPDGRNLVFRGDEVGPSDPYALYAATVGEVSYRRLPETEGATQPFWSPDGRHIAFLADSKLQRIDASGGPAAEITAAPNFQGGSWNENDVIIFGSSSGIYRVSAQGGSAELVTTPADGESGHYWPHFLPDGRRFLYLAWAADPTQRAVYVASLDSAEPRQVMAAESNVGVTAAGNLVFHRAGAVYAVPLSPDALTPEGEPTRIADGVAFAGSQGRGLFEVSRDGVLVYSQGSADVGTGPEAARLQPTWVERGGQEIDNVGPYYPYRGVEVSPDGTRIALHRHEASGGDVWVVEPSGTDTRITYAPERDNSMPIWSPDGRYLVFNAQRDGKWGLYRGLSDRGNTEELLYESDQLVFPMSWSPDGTHIVFGSTSPETSRDIWVLPLEAIDGDVAGEPELFIGSRGDETHGQVSPDGRWLAYASNETDPGQYEIYVSPFPSGLGRWQVSRTGGDWPRWSRDGTELFFLPNIPEGSAQFRGRRPLSAVKVTPVGDRFVHEPPEPVLTFNQINLSHPGGDYPTYAVGPDGNFVVFILAIVRDAAADTMPDTILPDVTDGVTLARHWEAGLTPR
jgi:Tol biopolymer transport system component